MHMALFMHPCYTMKTSKHLHIVGLLALDAFLTQVDASVYSSPFEIVKVSSDYGGKIAFACAFVKTHAKAKKFQFC